MGSKFGKNYPALLGNKSHDRERVVFIAAIGLAFSLIIIFVTFLNLFSNNADAKRADTGVITNAPPAVVGTVTLYAPDRVVKAGTKLSDVTFKEVYWPRNQVPENAVRDLSEIKALYAKMDLNPSMPIQKDHVANQPNRATLQVAPGFRAVAISVDDTSGIEGHALPGSKVDVILTYMEESNLTSKVIVENARVLSYGGDTTPGYEMTAISASAPRKTSRTITLEVTPNDGLKIQTSGQLGKLSLMMRAPEDDKAPTVKEINRSDIDGNRAKKEKGGGCSRGTARMGGREYSMNCDGTITELMNSQEP